MIFTRADILIGGTLTIIWHIVQSMDKSHPLHTGCIVRRADAETILNGERRAFSNSLISGSGNREFDYALAQSLTMMSDLFNVKPTFTFFDDAEKPNAMAIPPGTFSRSDGDILFGLRLLRNLMAQTEHPEIAVAAVCAHEYGHIAQFKKGLIRTLQGRDSTVRRIELHADFLSGYFAGHRKRQRPSFPAVVFATTAYSSGDFGFNNPNHHGTPAERGAAIVAGFHAGYRDRQSPSDAIDTGIRYAQAV